MRRTALLAAAAALVPASAPAQQVPNGGADIPVTSRDRFYTGDQFSNTISVVDPSSNTLVGLIRLGDLTPANLSPLYRGQLLVHGIGFSPDHKTLVAVSIGSNSVTFIDTASNAVKATTYVGRSPHEAFFTPDGREVWVTVRGEDYVSVLDAGSFQEIARIRVPNGPGMTIFSPDGQYGYVCSSFTPETVVVATATRRIVGRVRQESPFCPNIAATPDGRQVWLTLKDIGRVMVFEARPPFGVLRSIATGAITNHVNFARTANGLFAYVSVATENVVKVFRTDDFRQVARVPVGSVPHGLWPSGDGRRIYVGLENGDAAVAIDTATNRVIATIPIGQGPQGVAYVPNAVPEGHGTGNLVARDEAYGSSRLVLSGKGTTQVSLFNQGPLQTLQAVSSGLQPGSPYILAFAARADGSGRLEPIAAFTANPAGAAVVNAIGPIRPVVAGSTDGGTRYLVIASGSADRPGEVLQVQQR